VHCAQLNLQCFTVSSTCMNEYKLRKEREFKAIGILGIAFAVFCIWTNFREFYTIAILQETSTYSFSKRATPWYYKSSQLYAAFELCIGLLFLVSALLLFWGLFKGKRAMVFITFGILMLLFAFL